MGRLDYSANLIGRINTRMQAIDRELRWSGSVPEEADAPAVRDRLPDGQRDSVRDLRVARLASERRQLERRLRQIWAGEAITCRGCRELIAIDRLRAVLTATRCIVCQTHFERRDSRRLRTFAIV